MNFTNLTTHEQHLGEKIGENTTKYRNVLIKQKVAQDRKKMSYKTTEVSRGKIKPDIFYCPLETCFVIHFCCLLCDFLWWIVFPYLVVLLHVAGFLCMLASYLMDGSLSVYRWVQPRLTYLRWTFLVFSLMSLRLLDRIRWSLLHLVF